MRVVPDEALAAVAVDSEAEGEIYVAKLGVAEVIRNRMRTRFFSDGTLVNTLWRRAQFSAFSLMSEPDRKNLIRAFQIDDSSLPVQDCLRAWREAQAGSETVKGARMFYAAKAPTPYWADEVKFVIQLGGVRFYLA